MPSIAEVERQLTALSAEDWQPVNFVRSDDGSYEVILRRDDREEHAAAVLESLEASAPDIRTEILPGPLNSGL